MKLKNTLLYAAALSAGMVTTSCDDFLDREPITNITPESYFKADSELAAYTINYYNNIFGLPGAEYNAGPINWDANTDNMIVGGANLGYFADNHWLVGAGQALSFGMVRVCNYFFEQVLPKYEAGTIQGNQELIKHYIGEMYFMRAATYFDLLKTFGDYPIVTEVLPDNLTVLAEASRRQPRNKVARFILEDLDKAIDMCQSKAFDKVRINKEAAQLMKARVALYEASFEKYHSGTPRVPGEEGWPGAKMEYNANATFNIPGEIDFFLNEAIEASQAVADAHDLTPNNHKMNPEYMDTHIGNPYYDMFCQEDLSEVDEVLLWRDYSKALNCANGYQTYVQMGGGNGMTKSYVDAYLMNNGLPIYAAGSGYTTEDDRIDKVKANRDERLQLFLFGESTVNYNQDPQGQKLYDPTIIYLVEHRDLTGFRQRKWMCYDQVQMSDGPNGINGFPIMRSAEAYLIYMEASYMKNGNIDAKAAEYWKALRTRAGVDPDFNKTIAATDLSKEPDWAKYSGSNLVDETLYNIRRERRCEFIGEGRRFEDLQRWRAFDAMFPENMGAYVPVGCNFWTSMWKDKYYYDETTGKELLSECAPGNTDANMSAKDDNTGAPGKYIKPYRKILENNEVADGYRWKKAHYLAPLGSRDIDLNVIDDVKQVYQNPYWPETANQGAIE